MRIAIEANPMAIRKGGIGYYTQNLVEHLLKRDTENEYVLFYFNLSIKQARSLPVFEGCSNYSNFLFPKQALRFGLQTLKKPDVVHGTSYRLFAEGRKGSVVTVHDLGFMKYPHFVRKFGSEKMARRVKSALEDATLIITVSENSKKDILEYFPVQENRIVVTYEGINEKFFQKPDETFIRQAKQKYNITKNYILFVGTLEPRKNIPALIRAYGAASSLHGDFQLVLAGGLGWVYDEIFDAIEKCTVKDGIILTSYIAWEEVHALYHGASLFVFPSFYEGFGLPPLEAMACGTPVITSNVSSLPEVVGDAALLVNPEKEEDIARAMEKVLGDRQFAAQMARKGLERAKMFSWEKTAEQTLKIYEKVYNGDEGEIVSR